MDSTRTENEELSPIIFYYDELDGLEYLWPKLEERFQQSGHARRILFREYDSYKELRGQTAICIRMTRSLYPHWWIRVFSDLCRKPLPAGACFPGSWKKARFARDPTET